eukprot:SAG31_NODE_12602_length_930_cov_1.261131_1_plen_151_part_00
MDSVKNSAAAAGGGSSGCSVSANASRQAVASWGLLALSSNDQSSAAKMHHSAWHLKATLRASTVSDMLRTTATIVADSNAVWCLAWRDHGASSHWCDAIRVVEFFCAAHNKAGDCFPIEKWSLHQGLRETRPTQLCSKEAFDQKARSSAS